MDLLDRTGHHLSSVFAERLRPSRRAGRSDYVCCGMWNLSIYLRNYSWLKVFFDTIPNIKEYLRRPGALLFSQKLSLYAYESICEWFLMRFKMKSVWMRWQYATRVETENILKFQIKTLMRFVCVAPWIQWIVPRNIYLVPFPTPIYVRKTSVLL